MAYITSSITNEKPWFLIGTLWVQCNRQAPLVWGNTQQYFITIAVVSVMTNRGELENCGSSVLLSASCDAQKNKRFSIFLALRNACCWKVKHYDGSQHGARYFSATVSRLFSRWLLVMGIGIVVKDVDLPLQFGCGSNKSLWSICCPVIQISVAFTSIMLGSRVGCPKHIKPTTLLSHILLIFSMKVCGTLLQTEEELFGREV